MVAECFRQTLIGFCRRHHNSLNDFTANFVFNSNHSYHYARGEGMKHNTKMMQWPEFAGRERDYTFVSHQQEVGAGYFDDVTTVLQACVLAGGPALAQKHSMATRFPRWPA